MDKHEFKILNFKRYNLLRVHVLWFAWLTKWGYGQISWISLHNGLWKNTLTSSIISSTTSHKPIDKIKWLKSYPLNYLNLEKILLTNRCKDNFT